MYKVGFNVLDLSPVLNFPFFNWYFLLEIAEAYLKKVSSVKKSENSYFGGLKFGKWKLRL